MRTFHRDVAAAVATGAETGLSYPGAASTRVTRYSALQLGHRALAVSRMAQPTTAPQGRDLIESLIERTQAATAGCLLSFVLQRDRTIRDACISQFLISRRAVGFPACCRNNTLFQQNHFRQLHVTGRWLPDSRKRDRMFAPGCTTCWELGMQINRFPSSAIVAGQRRRRTHYSTSSRRNQ